MNKEYLLEAWGYIPEHLKKVLFEDECDYSTIAKLEMLSDEKPIHLNRMVSHCDNVLRILYNRIKSNSQAPGDIALYLNNRAILGIAGLHVNNTYNEKLLSTRQYNMLLGLKREQVVEDYNNYFKWKVNRKNGKRI
jgi:hypothetical protein